MAKVIDLRRNGGDMVLIGKSLTLPTANDPIETGNEPLVGAMRYNPDTGYVEIYLPRGDSASWFNVGVTEQQGAVVYVTGAIMSGDLRQNGGRFLADGGSVTRPGIGFNLHETTGLSLSDGGSMQVGVNGVLALDIGSGTIDAKLPLKAASAAVTALSATSAQANAATIQALTATVSSLGTAQATSLTVSPPAGSTNLISEAAFTTQGRVWTATHEADHTFTLRADTSRVFTFRENGTLEAQFFSGQAASVRNGDLAERYHADAVYEPGTVLVIGGVNEVTTTPIAGDPRVAGVVSTNPGLRLNEAAGDDGTHPFIALKGRVPCKVVGPIRKGQILIPSSTRGHAMAALGWNDEAAIGKALQDFPGHGTGIIEIKV